MSGTPGPQHRLLCATTAVARKKQAHVELVNFGLDGYNNLVIDVLICCNHISNSTVNNGHLNSKIHTNDYLQARVGSKTGGTKMIILLLVWRLHLQLCQWLAKFILSFFVSCGSWLTNRRTITMRSSAQRRRLEVRLSRGVELARLVLTRNLLVRVSLMPGHTPTTIRAQYSSAVASSRWPAHFICWMPHVRAVYASQRAAPYPSPRC